MLHGLCVEGECVCVVGGGGVCVCGGWRGSVCMWWVEGECVCVVGGGGSGVCGGWRGECVYVVGGGGSVCVWWVEGGVCLGGEGWSMGGIVKKHLSCIQKIQPFLAHSEHLSKIRKRQN